MKKVVVILLVAVLLIALCSCSEPIVTSIGGVECNIGKVATASEVGGVKAEGSGNVLMTVNVEPASAIDADKYTEVFFGETKSVAASDSGKYECKAIGFAQDDDGTLVGVPIYEIPAPGEKPTEYTISGQGFDSFTVSVKASK